MPPDEECVMVSGIPTITIGVAALVSAAYVLLIELVAIPGLEYLDSFG
jgi:hypothetical protein